MRPIPQKLRKQLSEDPEYKVCIIKDQIQYGQCHGKITFQHALMYAGRQIQERFAILPMCVRHHLGDLHNQRRDEIIAMRRATEEDKLKYPRLQWNIYS